MPVTDTPTGMENIGYLSHDIVPLESLAEFVKNPRKGNIRAIAESLFENRQYRPIVLWTHEKGKKRKQPEILAGNHTWKGAKFLDSIAKGEQEKPAWLTAAEKRLKRKVRPWPTIGVVSIDATKEEARKIVLADNRTAELGGYDPEALRDLLADLPDPFGTGFTVDEFELVTKAMDESNVDIAEAMSRLDAVNADDDDFGKAGSSPLFASPPPEEEEEPEGPRALLDAPTELEGTIMSLQEEPRLPSKGPWEIPVLRQDMMIEEIPDPLETWAGSATKNWPEEVTWLYNYGIDSTSGMTEHGKRHIMLSFYAWDEYFETWWFNLKDHVIRALNSDIKLAITPNFSQGDMPRVNSLWNLYRSRYIGRYMQEAGIRIMPDLEGLNDPEMMQYMSETLPKKLPWASIQVQNVGAKTRAQKADAEKNREAFIADAKAVLSLIKPDNLFVYANDNGFELMTDIVRKDLKIKGMHLHHQSTRLEKLAKKAKKAEGDKL